MLMEDNFTGHGRASAGVSSWKIATTCRACGRAPAGDVTFRQVSAVVLVSHHKKIQAPMCKSCARRTGRSMQAATLTTGWWGIFAFFANLRAVFSNTLALAQVSKMPDPVGPEAAPAMKQPPVFARPQPWILTLVIAAAITAAVLLTAAASTSPPGSNEHVPPTAQPVEPTRSSPSWEVGACVAGDAAYLPVDCATAHVGRIVAGVSAPSSCPAGADSYVSYEGNVLCIDLQE